MLDTDTVFMAPTRRFKRYAVVVVVGNSTVWEFIGVNPSTCLPHVVYGDLARWSQSGHKQPAYHTCQVVCNVP